MPPNRERPSSPSLFQRQFSSLSVYNFRLFFCGQAVSLIGTWMQTTGQAWLVLQMTGSAVALGTVTTLQFLPVTLLTLFGGVFADRLPKRRILVVTQTLALFQALALGLLVSSGRVELWEVYALSFTLGIVNALDGPVRQSFIVELVGREQIANAIALNSSIFNLARIFGPGLGGVIIGLAGIGTAFYLNAASFVAVLAAYALMRRSEFAPVAPRGSASVLQQLVEGLRCSWQTPAILFGFILMAFFGTFGFNFTVVIPLVAEFVLKVGPERFGLLSSCMGIGSLAGALAVAAFGRASPRLLLADAAAFAGLLALVPFAGSFWATGAVLAVLGVTTIVFSTTILSTVQLSAPNEMRGRVSSIYQLLFLGSTPIGGYLTGRLAGAIGVRPTLLIEASACAFGLLVALVYYRARQPHAPHTPDRAPALPAAAD